MKKLKRLRRLTRFDILFALWVIVVGFIMVPLVIAFKVVAPVLERLHLIKPVNNYVSPRFRVGLLPWD